MKINRRLRIVLFLLIGSLMLLLSVADFIWFQLLGYANAFLIFGGGFALVEGLVRLRIKKSDNTDDARENMVQMIKKAKDQILISSGTLDSDAYLFWENGRIIEAIKSKVGEKVGEKNIRVEIVSGEPIDPKTKEKLLVLCSEYNNIKLYICREDPVPHGIMIDKKYLRLEGQHQPKSTIRSNSYINNPGIAGRWFVNLFRKYQLQSRQISPEESPGGKVELA